MKGFESHVELFRLYPRSSGSDMRFLEMKCSMGNELESRGCETLISWKVSAIVKVKDDDDDLR